MAVVGGGVVGGGVFVPVVDALLFGVVFVGIFVCCVAFLNV